MGREFTKFFLIVKKSLWGYKMKNLKKVLSSWCRRQVLEPPAIQRSSTNCHFILLCGNFAITFVEICPIWTFRSWNLQPAAEKNRRSWNLRPAAAKNPRSWNLRPAAAKNPRNWNLQLAAAKNPRTSRKNRHIFNFMQIILKNCVQFFLFHQSGITSSKCVIDDSKFFCTCNGIGSVCIRVWFWNWLTFILIKFNKIFLNCVNFFSSKLFH